MAKMINEKPIQWTFNGECIRCTSHFHDRENYPFLTRKGRRMKIGRHILFKKYGEQPDRIVTRHTCDNSWCINPNHIIIGTDKQNSDDKVARGRTNFGQKHWNNRLSLEQLREIWSMMETHTRKEVALKFGISPTHVSNIKSGHRCSKESMRVLEG